MAVDDMETEYHLTPSGWVQGTYYFFGKTQKEIAPPADRVLTIVERVYQRSQWSAEERSVTEKWRSPKVTDEEIKELRRRFPFSN